MLIGGPRRARTGGNDANIVAMLSLKLLLLAFFILLATISQLEERRTRAVMQSLSSTFKGQVPAVAGSPQTDRGISIQERQQSVSQQIRQLFRQTLPVVEVETAADGRILRLEVPADRLFRPGESELAARRGTLLRRLARVLNGPDAPANYAVEVLHGAGADHATDTLGLQVERTGVIVRRLARHGVPRGRLAVGLAPATADETVAFEIRLPETAPTVNAAPANNAPANNPPAEASPQ